VSLIVSGEPRPGRAMNDSVSPVFVPCPGFADVPNSCPSPFASNSDGENR